MPKGSSHQSRSIHKRLFIGDCLTGGTIVSVKRGTKARKMSIEELYLCHNGNHHNKSLQKTKVLSAIDDHAGMNNLLEIVHSGEKELLQIHTISKKIRSSYEHKFMTDLGWVEAKNLEKGTFLATWRSSRGEQQKRKNKPRNYAYSLPYHPNAMAHVIGGINYKRKPFAHIVLEAAMNGLSPNELIRILRKEPILATALHYLPIDTVVHHLNGDQLDDSIENLQIVTDTEHNELHHAELIFRSKSIEFEPIISIEKGGNANTFDLCMESPHNNFIANGIVVHNSGTGKTTALLSLVKAGFKLRIFDFDNLLDPLMAKCRKECPDLLDSIEYMSFRDEIKSSEFGPIVPNPKAFVSFLKALDKWEDGSIPSKWGEEYVAVIDSHTTQARSAYFWARGLQGASGLAEGVAAKGVEPRAIYHTAQQAVMNCISEMTAESFNTNLIVIAHIKYMENGGITKGFPMSVGTAISPEIPTYFPEISLATKNGHGDNMKRIIRTRSTELIDLKDSRAFDPSFATELPMETGLATLFQ